MINKLMVNSHDEISLEIYKRFNEIVLLIEQSELIDSKLSTNHTDDILDELAMELNDIIDRSQLK